MKDSLRFDYTSVLGTLEARIDEDSRYAEVVEHFEFFVSRNKTIGDPIDRPPLVFRRFVVKIPNLRPLAFYYYIAGRGGKTIFVFRIEFAEETPL
jgi:hypothetical protein